MLRFFSRVFNCSLKHFNDNYLKVFFRYFQYPIHLGVELLPWDFLLSDKEYIELCTKGRKEMNRSTLEIPDIVKRL